MSGRLPKRKNYTVTIHAKGKEAWTVTRVRLNVDDLLSKAIHEYWSTHGLPNMGKLEVEWERIPERT